MPCNILEQLKHNRALQSEIKKIICDVLVEQGLVEKPKVPASTQEVQEAIENVFTVAQNTQTLSESIASLALISQQAIAKSDTDIQAVLDIINSNIEADSLTPSMVLEAVEKAVASSDDALSASDAALGSVKELETQILVMVSAASSAMTVATTPVLSWNNADSA